MLPSVAVAGVALGSSGIKNKKGGKIMVRRIHIACQADFPRTFF